MFSRNIGNLISGIFATVQPNGQSLASKKEVPMQKKPTDPKIHRRAGNVSDSTPFSQDRPAVSKPEPRVPLTTPAVSGDREGTLPAELTLFIPFRKYTFTLNHQILSRLGNVSQFVFRALATDGCAIDDVARLTGLSSTHLAPILERLAGFGWYDLSSGALTTHGRMMAQAVALHGRRFSLWIDSHDNRSQAQILLSEDRFCEPEKVVTGTTLSEFERDWNILAVLQQQRLYRRLGGGKEHQGELLPLLKTLFDSASHGVLDHQSQAWDFRLEIDRDSSQCRYLAVTLPQGFYPGDGKGRKKLYAPVLNYRITRTLPAWFAEDMAPPAPVSFTFCLLTGHKLNEPGHEEQASSWPAEMMLSRLALMDKMRVMIPPSDPLIGQEVSLTLATRKLALSYDVLARELVKSMPSRLGDES